MGRAFSLTAEEKGEAIELKGDKQKKLLGGKGEIIGDLHFPSRISGGEEIKSQQVRASSID